MLSGISLNGHRRWLRATVAGLVALGGISVASGGTSVAANAAPASGTKQSLTKQSLTKQDADLAPHRPGAILVAFEPTASTADRAAARSAAKATKSRRLSPKTKDTEVVTLSAGDTVTGALQRLKGKRGVRYAEPDYLLTTTAVSNDPEYTGGSLWGMYGADTTPSNAFGSAAATAWAQGHTGSSSVAVGIIDEGLQFAHSDLATNIWTNPDEVAGNGIDDDSNGYVDDVHGWDFINNNATVFDGNSTEGSDTHGTHVAGTIGGIGGNGAGVAGVNWAVTMVSAKFLGPSGGYTSDAVSALDYLRALKRDKGLNIVTTSNSWGGGGYSSTLATAIENAGDQGMLFVAAAGNSSNDNDASPSYPSNYECTKGGTRGYDCVIAVASITSSGSLSSFSSYGATTVDIGAPGSGIVSTYPDNSYASLSGTSMATPHVSGAVALCASINPALTPGQLRNAVVNSARPTDALVGKVVNSGRLDIAAMVAACSPAAAAVSGSIDSLTDTSTSWTRVDLSWTDNASNEQFYEIQRASSTAGNCGTFSTVATIGASSTSFAVSGLSASTTYCFRVRATNGFGGGTAVTSNEFAVTTLAAPAPYTCLSSSYQWIGTDAGTPTYYTLSDDASTPVTLPFTFAYYGVQYTTGQLSSNGFLRLGSGAATSYSNTSIPSGSDPNSFVAPWWDDLYPPAGGTIWSMTTGTAPNRQFVVTWSDIQTYAISNSGVTFQLVLDEATSDVFFQYQETATGSTANDNGGTATIGLESVDGAFGTQVGYLQKVAAAGTAYRCTNGSTNFPSITTSSLAAGTVDTGYAQTVAGSGGTTPYDWAISSGSLPAGLQLDSTTGEISGVPTTAGTSTFTVRLTDADSYSATRSLSITIAAPVSVTTASLPGGTTGTSYSQTVAATGGTGSYTWAITSGSLPGGLSLTASSGRISGTPNSAGTFSFTIRATDTAGRTATKDLSITVITPVSVSTSSLPAGTVSASYSQTLAATGGAAPYTWSISSGSLPSGLALNAGTGEISGTPTSTGTTSFTVRVTDSVSATATRSLSITVAAAVSVTTATLPNGAVGTSYSQTVAATGGTGSYTWAITSGSLPGGLTLTASSGRISGTPNSAGTFSFTIRATDTAGRTATKDLSITIAGAIPGSFSKSSPSNNSSSRPRNGLVLTWAASVGAVSYEYCFDSTRNGVCNSTWVSVGSARTVTLNGLGSKISYEWQVRAVNSSGTRLANNGSWWKFTTVV